MEIRNLATFLQVATMQSFTKASRVLGYSQSNVSAQIQQLEEDIGVPLFDRIGRGVVLTQYGQELLQYAQLIVSTAEHMQSFLRAEHELAGSLRIGTVESLLEACFEPCILQYSRRFPNVHIDLTVDATATLLELVLKNQIDVACLIDDPLPKSRWQCCYQKEVEVVLVASREHPLAAQGSIELEQLSREKCILMEDSAPYNRHFRRLLESGGIQLEPFLTLQNSGMARRLAAQSGCLSFLPDYTVKQAVRSGELVVLAVPGYVQYQTVQIILHRDKLLTPQIKGFLEEARQIFDRALSREDSLTHQKN